ncbi:hypothetical protein AU476_19315 [Cupriavidus sp. UYMSc13B]|nr:hypothetical protein AU476_19315 [Cupriavidus sp. UYMSc13B]
MNGAKRVGRELRAITPTTLSHDEQTLLLAMGQLEDHRLDLSRVEYQELGVSRPDPVASIPLGIRARIVRSACSAW